jgi:hypothetical protein
VFVIEGKLIEFERVNVGIAQGQRIIVQGVVLGVQDCGLLSIDFWRVANRTKFVPQRKSCVTAVSAVASETAHRMRTWASGLSKPGRGEHRCHCQHGANGPAWTAGGIQNLTGRLDIPAGKRDEAKRKHERISLVCKPFGLGLSSVLKSFQVDKRQGRQIVTRKIQQAAMR